mgnify:CR=1 FL=1
MKPRMRIQVINPNTTASMTAKIAAAARLVASPGTDIVATQPDEGPVSIEGYFDEALSVPGILEEIARGEGQEIAGHVIACFDDTGLDAARCFASAPVVGIGEAAYHMASLVAGRFTVVTTLARSIPALEHNLVRYGLASRCGGVRAAEVPVLALEDPHSSARDRVSGEIDRAIRDDRAEAIVLGCAGMADLARSLSAEHGLPVIEGVSAAVRLIEDLSVMGLSTSRIGGWASPRRKPLSGRYAVFSRAS